MGYGKTTASSGTIAERARAEEISVIRISAIPPTSPSSASVQDAFARAASTCCATTTARPTPRAALLIEDLCHALQPNALCYIFSHISTC